ncbi:MAG: ATP-binding protein [Bdellovibrionales bacterium]|nr:ATP-binding protein [Bdellovibrionales bacterium]
MQVFSWIYDGVTPKLIRVEYHARFQIPSFSVLGLPGPEIQEARERIVAAFHASEIEFPKKKIIINLAPASIKKWGTGHDLAIATAILQASIEIRWPKTLLAWGELGLDGKIKPRGQMAALIELLLETPIGTLCLSPEDAEELTELLSWRQQQGLELPHLDHVVVLSHLRELISRVKSPPMFRVEEIPALPLERAATPHLLPLPRALARTLEIAIAGRHHLLLLGPKGIGKSQSLDWLKVLTPSAHPRFGWMRALRDPAQSPRTLQATPFRQVHSQIRPAHLLGSWRSHRLESGELALAHGGVLIADEFLEWPRDTRECLREPLQNRKFFLSRVQGKVSIDCDFQFVATGNLCPCGGLPPRFYGFTPLPAERLKKWRCRCRPNDVDHYLSKLSGPIGDRIDLVTVLYDLPDPREPARPADELAARIGNAQAFAQDRWAQLPNDLSPIMIESQLPRTAAVKRLLERTPSLRSRHKIARIGFTLQALEQSSELKEEHLFEASVYRFMEHMSALESAL